MRLLSLTIGKITDFFGQRYPQGKIVTSMNKLSSRNGGGRRKGRAGTNRRRPQKKRVTRRSRKLNV